MKRRLGIAQALNRLTKNPHCGRAHHRSRSRRTPQISQPSMAKMSQGDSSLSFQLTSWATLSSLCNQMVMLNRGHVVYNGSPRRADRSGAGTCLVCRGGRMTGARFNQNAIPCDIDCSFCERLGS
jgi:hypothetical protein